MPTQDELDLLIVDLERITDQLRAVRAKQVVQQATVLPFPRARCEPDCRAFTVPCDHCPDGAA